MADANISPTLQASSALRKTGMSTTLPRNFAPLSLDSSSDLPRTPDQTFAELSLPPPLAASTYRIRRPRINMENLEARNNALPPLLFASEIRGPSSPVYQRSELSSSLPQTAYNSDEPVPSIETPTARRPILLRGVSEPMTLDHTLQVPAAYQPPQTPPAQTSANTLDVKRGKWDMQRAASVCSARSESSIDSSDTYATRPTSFDGSATSPDCDNQDPFSPQLVNIIPDTPTRRSKKIRTRGGLSRDNAHWTIEMDNHLFNVYQMYLADPTVTPFKTVPGSIPPTGVCHRVARKAKDTWSKASRIDVPIVRRYRVRNLLDIRRTMRDKTPELDDFLKTDDGSAYDSRATWPSESATRRRLKQLCREKFTISAHYQRLRESRSPSPFSEQFTRRPTSRLTRSVSHGFEDDQNASFMTRELGISLVANDATAPLARLVAEDAPTIQTSSVQDWFNTPISSDPMNLSTPLAPAAQQDRLAPVAAKIPRLASPFNYSTWNGPSNKNPHRRHISHGQYDTIHATGSRLLSPFRPEENAAVNINKRRAQRDLEEELSPRGSNLALAPTSLNVMALDSTMEGTMDIPPFQPKPELNQEIVFSGNGDLNQRRIRIRNRGATLGSAIPTFSSAERFEQFFAETPGPASDIPPIPSLPSMIAADPLALAQQQSQDKCSLAVPQVEDPVQRRLGSPFVLDPTKRSLRNKSPRHVPSLSDPFISTDHFGLNSDSTSTTSFSNAGTHTTLGSGIGNIGERLALFGTLQEHYPHDQHTPN